MGNIIYTFFSFAYTCDPFFDISSGLDFAVSFAMVVLLLIEYLLDEQFLSKKNAIKLFLWMFLMCVIRNNGVYVLTFLLLSALLLKARRKFLILLTGVIIFVFVYQGPVYALCGVQKGTALREMLMLRDSVDVQLDNVARIVICNNVADCHIALHWDSGDGKNYDKGCFYISVPEALKNMEPVASHWQQHDTLGTDLVEGLREQGTTIYGKGHMGIDLTQTSYSTIPSVDMELGNAYSDHSDEVLEQLATGLLTGINTYFEQ